MIRPCRTVPVIDHHDNGTTGRESVTVTSVPNGSHGWAAVSAAHGGSYQDANPDLGSAVGAGHLGRARVHRLGGREPPLA